MLLSNIIPKIGLGIGFCIVFFIPIIGIAVIFNLSNACIWGMVITIILFTASLSDEGALTLMDSFTEIEKPVEEKKKCSFCGENHNDDECYYMGIDDLTGGKIL